MEQLDSSQVHLCLAFLDEIADPRLLDEYWQLLSREEQQQQRRFYFERDRHRYLVTRALVRTVLSKYTDVAPRDWTFVVNPYGRPSIATEHVPARGIEFNISHTQGLVVLGITRGRALGVDVENVRARRAALEIADRFLAPDEVAELRALPAAEQPQRFFEYWTLRESYIKARGMGLALPLEPTLGDCTDRWLFWQLRAEPDYLAAVCAERQGSSLRMVTRRIVPLLLDEPFACSFLQCSK